MTQHIQQAIRRATPSDTSRVTDLIAVAFHPLAVSAWLVPDPRERIRALSGDFYIMVDHAIAHGMVDVIDAEHDPIAAAVWFPEITGPTKAPQDYQSRLSAATGQAVPRFRMLDDKFDETHPTVYPHHYLLFLATRPGAQSQGLGTALLEHHHRGLDEQGISGFLHASCARTRDFYTRHGYEARDPFHLPQGPPMWPMWRPAREG